MLSGLKRAGVLAFLLLATPVAAQEPYPDAASAWRSLTQMDVEAAHALLADNHPAAAPETGDPAFGSALASSYAEARDRAKTVSDFRGYVATLGEFANAMGDGHIWSQPIFVPAYVKWAGIVIAKRNSDWVVSKEDRDVVGRDLLNARLVSCGGVPVDNFARDTLGRYDTVWSVEANRVLFAWRLLVDDGNPFVKRPDACIFDTETGEQTVSLNWTRISRVKLVPLVASVAGHAGYGVRASGAGYWIAIESLGGKAQAVVDAAKADQKDLRAAPWVVLDLRGDGGGSDDYGRQLAETLYGEAYADAVIGPRSTEADLCPSAWRASQGNIDGVTRSADAFERNGEIPAAKAYRQAAVDMRAAMTAHRPFTAALTCKASSGVAAQPPPSLMRGRVIVLTDSVCFSSCVNVVEFFVKLGAVLAGQTTGADTHYSEVREITLPSGLSTFSTLQAVMVEAPLHIGPFIPTYPYAGDISDTAALESWIAADVAPKLMAR